MNLFLVCIALCQGPTLVWANYDEYDGMKALLGDKLDTYETRLRPRNQQADIVEVNTRFVPQTLLEFETSEQKFSVLGYFEVSWKDEVVTWTSTSNTSSLIRLPVKNIWRPSLIIMKAFDGNGAVGNTKTDIVQITSAGDVQWVPSGIVSVVCDVAVKFYPFDRQTCTITYFVSDETITTVELDHSAEVSMDKYTENSEWLITSVNKRRYLKYNTYYIDLEFNLERRPSFTTFTLIMPLLLLAFLNICMFLVPIGSGEKGGFAITIFLSYGIYVTIVSDLLPDNSLQVSYLLLFIILLLFMSVLSVLYTIIQSKVVARIGEQECSVQIFRKLSKSKNTDNEVENYPSPRDEKAQLDEEPYTWVLFLSQLDMFLFVVCFFLTLIFSIVFLCLMTQVI